MDAEALKNLILQVPWGVVILILRWMDIKEKSAERQERDEQAKQKAISDRETQLIVGKAYADAINNLASIIGDFKNTVVEHYKNMGITQDLLDMARENFNKEPNTKQRRS